MPTDFLRLSRLLDLSAEGRVITNIGNVETDFNTDGGIDFADDALVRLGNDADQVFLNRSTALALNTVVANVILGTPVVPAIAANSLIISNITASGTIILIGNRGGNSEAYLQVDPNTGNLALFSRGTGSLDLYDDATQIVDAVSGTWAFQQATTMSAAVGVLSITSPTLTTPTIAATGWTSANHAHAAADSGGQIPLGNITSVFAVPSIVFGSAATAGVAGTTIRSDATIAAFDAVNPAAVDGAAAGVGTAAFSARRDHVHLLGATITNALIFNSVLTSAVAGAGDAFIPSADNQGGIGSTARRWQLVRAVTVTSGDFMFENGWRLTEAENLGLLSGVALVRSDGSISQVFN